MIKRLYCGTCREVVEYEDHVYLDILNGVKHQECYHGNYEIKDKGTFREIVNRYNFFDEFKVITKRYIYYPNKNHKQ